MGCYKSRWVDGWVRWATEMYLSKCLPALMEASLQSCCSWLSCASSLACAMFCFIWPELSPRTQKQYRCHKWQSKRCTVHATRRNMQAVNDGSKSVSGVRHLVHLQLILTHKGAKSPDTQHWWNFFPTGKSKRNGMKFCKHWALPPKEPSCQTTNIMDCNCSTSCVEAGLKHSLSSRYRCLNIVPSQVHLKPVSDI